MADSEAAEVDSYSRKRTRYCQHCDKNVNYKRHKEEFYDSDKKEWTKCHATVEEDLDAIKPMKRFVMHLLLLVQV